MLPLSLAALYLHPSDANLLGVLTLLVQAWYPHPNDAKVARGTLKHALLVYIHVIVNDIKGVALAILPTSFSSYVL